MNGLDLFSGIGGIGLALGPWVRTIAYCERDPYAQSVLLERMREGSLRCAPIWNDVQTLTGKMLPPVDIIFGGFPCQDISSAGRGAGLAGNRSGLFFEVVRLMEEARPRFVFLENVPAIRTRGLRQVVGAFTDLRYDCRWTCVSAASVGATHLRKRWFLLATDSQRIGGGDEHRGIRGQGRESSAIFVDDGAQEFVADANRLRKSSEQNSGEITPCRTGDGGEAVIGTCFVGEDWWSVEPDVGRSFDGISSGMDRDRGLGDAEAKETGADEVLQYLREGPGAEALQRATRGLGCVQAEEVLFSFVCEYERGGRLPREFVASAATPEGILRAMRGGSDAPRSSHGRGSAEQYFREYPDALRVLSQFVASRSETPWSSSLWESGIERVAHGVPNRVDRIKCLGNSVVPQQARQAFMILSGLKEEP